MANKQKTNDPAANPDPITHTPGSHPVGTGIGAAVGGAALGGAVVAGAATGAVGGSVAGPIGAVVGAAIGAVAGGLTGKGMAEDVNPSVEHEYWRRIYPTRPYVAPGSPYEEYGPAYQFGWESERRHSGRHFDEVEKDLAADWEQHKGESPLNWERAKYASRDAWERARAKDRRS